MLLAVSFNVNAPGRSILADVLGSVAQVTYLKDLDPAARRQALHDAAVLLAYNSAKELQPDELPLLRGKRLIQFLSAGTDWLPLDELPRDVPLAGNSGAYAEPMAEHALAMTLAAAKRLLVEHHNMAQGQFNQFTANKRLAGKVCGVFGFGGFGLAAARLMHCVGMHIQAINRRGAAPEAPPGLLDWIGKPDRLNELLHAADVLIISAALTPATKGAIGAPQLSLMKKDAILVNLARGEILDELALYDHLKANPQFTACIEAWWVEPVRHGEFRIRRPFFELPNLIGSPHNSAMVENIGDFGLRRAAENCRRALLGQTPLHLIPQDERFPRL